MYKRSSGKRRFGFTLVEVLVTTVVVGTMAAVVVPAMIKLAPAGDPARIASDLGSIKSAIDVFAQDFRPRAPGDIEDLVNVITATEKGIDGTLFRSDDVAKWKGPYLQWTVDPSTSDIAGSVTIFKSAAGTLVHSALYRCPAPSTGYSTGSDDAPCDLYSTNANVTATDRYIAIKLTGIPGSAGSEFVALNDVIDGKSEASPAINGLLRQNASGTVFFLATPYTKP